MKSGAIHSQHLLYHSELELIQVVFGRMVRLVCQISFAFQSRCRYVRWSSAKCKKIYKLAAKHDDLFCGKMKPDRDLEISRNSTLGCLRICKKHIKTLRENDELENVLAERCERLSPTFFGKAISVIENFIGQIYYHYHGFANNNWDHLVCTMVNYMQIKYSKCINNL